MHAQPIAAPPSQTAQSAAEHAHYYRRVLHEVIDIGVDLGRLLHTKAKDHAEAASTTRLAVPNREPVPDGSPDFSAQSGSPDFSAQFERIARAIRRTVGLAQRLDDPVPARTHGPGQQRAATRRRIIREVEDAIQRHQPRDDAAESLYAEFAERLDGPDLDDDIDHRPAADIIADICRDLGIITFAAAHPWKRRTPADIAELCARAARSRPKPQAEPSADPRSDARAEAPQPDRGMATPPRHEMSSDPPSKQAEPMARSVQRVAAPNDS